MKNLSLSFKLFFKKKLNPIVFFTFIGIFSLFVPSSCKNSAENNGNGEKKTISLVTWNTQTFFDSITEGTEYPDFQKSNNWDLNKYNQRLQRICHVIETLDADIFLLQEIENKAVIHDIANMLAGNFWDKKKSYSYGAFSKEEGAALGCCILSKYPIKNIKTHCLQVKDGKDVQPSLRPILQATILVGNKPLNVFVNHWKSKSGGETATEQWRKWQEGVLCYAVDNAEGGKNGGLAVGDFNQDVGEFSKPNNVGSPYNLCLKGSLVNPNAIPCYSPWLTETGQLTTEIGSYFYKGNWERIDNILVFGNKITVEDFHPATNGPWTDENLLPLKYKYYTGEGYSDHLPLMCTISF